LDARIIAPFASVLVPLDGSDLAEEALPVARSFAEAFGSELHFVQVVPILLEGDGLEGEAYIPELMDSIVSAAQTYVARIAEAFKDRGHVTSDVLVGGAAYRLEEYIKEKSIGLVIMTSHGRGGIVRTALGSVTDRLIGGQSPVLVVRQ
jgi:nucleotide-binding universal stress UspA family protein